MVGIRVKMLCFNHQKHLRGACCVPGTILISLDTVTHFHLVTALSGRCGYPSGEMRLMKAEWLSHMEMLLRQCVDGGPRVLVSDLCVGDMEEVLTLPLQVAVARHICIAVAGRGDLELMATWRVQLECVTWGYCLLSLGVMVIQMRQSPRFRGGYRDTLGLCRLHFSVSPHSGPWWRPTCGRSVVWSSSCGSSRASGIPPSPA